MEEMLARIIELDEIEQKLTNEALRLKNDVKAQVDEYKKKINENMKAEVEAEVAKKKERYEREFNRQCAQIDKSCKDSEIRMKEKAASGHTAWVDSIVSRVIG